MSHKGLKLKVTGQGQDAVGLTSILDRGQFSSKFLTNSTTNIQTKLFLSVQKLTDKLTPPRQLVGLEIVIHRLVSIHKYAALFVQCQVHVLTGITTPQQKQTELRQYKTRNPNVIWEEPRRQTSRPRIRYKVPKIAPSLGRSPAPSNTPIP